MARVLVACEYSGAVRDAFIRAGHDAMSCDILPTEAEGPHYQGDVRDVLGDGWDLMIAHPPCTYLSGAGARWLYPGGKKSGNVNQERLRKGFEARDFFLMLFSAPIPRVAVENPTPLKVFGLPHHSQVVQPYEYGHPYSKRTLLWTRGLPDLTPTDEVIDYTPYLPSNTGAGRRKGQKSSTGTAHTWKDSARTFSGIAKAMADQWGSLL